jgi:glycosyltransferase involved in cell wall biosynthesis
MNDGDNAQHPVVSVVIPCYNYGAFVTEAVDSCLASTYPHYEIIVVDNGSTDPHTIDVLNRLVRPKTRVVRIKQNIGLPHGRNFGIKQARGRYIVALDADDKIHATLMEKAVRVLDGHPDVGFVTFGMRFFGDEELIWMPPPFTVDELLRRNIACVSSMFRKAAWEQVGGYDESMRDGYEDWDFWISLTERGWRCHRIEEVLFYYRRHGRTLVHHALAKHAEIVAYVRSKHASLYNRPR